MTPEVALKKLGFARKWINKGWGQGHLFSFSQEEGVKGRRLSLCAMGALIFASHRKARKQFVDGIWNEGDLRQDPCPLTTLLHEGMNQHDCTCGHIEIEKNRVACIERYNDNPERKKAQILALFDRAILFQSAQVAAGKTVAIPVPVTKAEIEECVGCQ